MVVLMMMQSLLLMQVPQGRVCSGGGVRAGVVCVCLRCAPGLTARVRQQVTMGW